MAEEKPRPLLQLRPIRPKPLIQGTRLEHERDTTDTFFERIDSVQKFNSFIDSVKKEAGEKERKKAEEDQKKQMEAMQKSQRKIVAWVIIVLVTSPIIGRAVEAIARKIFGF